MPGGGGRRRDHAAADAGRDRHDRDGGDRRQGRARHQRDGADLRRPTATRRPASATSSATAPRTTSRAPRPPGLSNTTAATRAAPAHRHRPQRRRLHRRRARPRNAGSGPPPPPDPRRARLIREIQGAAHRSPLAGAGRDVPASSPAIVQQRLLDPGPDPRRRRRDHRGRSRLHRRRARRRRRRRRDRHGTVDEFRPGGDAAPTSPPPSSPRRSSRSIAPGNALPAAAGRPRRPRAAAAVIERRRDRRRRDDRRSSTRRRTARLLRDPRGHARQVDTRSVVGPTQQLRRDCRCCRRGAGASLRTARGGIVVRASDFNPERIILDDAARARCRRPTSATRFAGPIVGVARLQLRQLQAAVDAPPPDRRPAACARGDPRRQRADELAVATFNVENLDPGDPPAKFDALAALIVDNLASPDIVALEEVQDNNGADQRRHRRRRARRSTSWSPRSRRPAVRPTSSARSTRSTAGRRRAGRQHPGRLPLPHRPRAAPSSTVPAATPTTRDRRVAAAVGQPR